MSSESVRKTNNEIESLGKWIQSNVQLPENPLNAALWPKDFQYARSLESDIEVYAVTAVDDSESCKQLEMLENVREQDILSYQLAESAPGQIDLEYSWAVADDTVRRGPREGLSAEEGMRKVAQTSEKMLRPGGVAVYNLDAAGGREELPFDSQMEFGRIFEDILKEDYGVEAEIYESPRMRDSNTHMVWKKPV